MRLINADELKGKAFADPDDGEYFVYCQDIDEAPTVDAVQVVRCRECIHFDPEGYGGASCAETGAMIWPNSDDYCSRGQRLDQSADVRNMDGGGADAP